MDQQENAFNWSEFGQRTWVVVVAGLVFAPLGIFLAWRKPDWTPKAKWIATGLMGLLFYGQFFNKPNAEVGNTQHALKVDSTLKGDATVCAETEKKLEPILEKCIRIKESGDGVTAAELYERKAKPLALTVKELRDKHKDKEAEFHEAVQNAKSKSAKGGGAHDSGMKYFTALELISLASNPARAKKELPSRFVVTGAIQEISQHSGLFGRKSYTVRVRGRINNRGLVDTWVECEMSNADGVDRLEKSSYAEIEGHFESAMSDVVEMTQCSLHKAYHDQ